MAFDTPRRYAAAPLDEPRHTPGSCDEEALMVELAEALRELGERATVRTPLGGSPHLDAVGADPRLSERITSGRRQDGTVCALWSWGEELPADIDQAAAAIRRVINPAV